PTPSLLGGKRVASSDFGHGRGGNLDRPVYQHEIRDTLEVPHNRFVLSPASIDEQPPADLPHRAGCHASPSAVSRSRLASTSHGVPGWFLASSARMRLDFSAKSRASLPLCSFSCDASRQP